ncbi:unnamed protein product [Phytophthora fragariaefolia]|uniref:Unnamed protein product n=1 Tax=Phytophthora fragariaefolia TaxID=1490495 RepID=A0A9W6XW05_9STRA|nr:unnamed protein product [Phytophthora fragariaefolia]
MGDSTNKETNTEHDTDAVMVDTTDEKTNAAKVDSMDKKTHAEHDANATTSDITDEKTNTEHDANAILADSINERQPITRMHKQGISCTDGQLPEDQKRCYRSYLPRSHRCSIVFQRHGCIRRHAGAGVVATIGASMPTATTKPNHSTADWYHPRK